MTSLLDMHNTVMDTSKYGFDKSVYIWKLNEFSPHILST